MSGSIKAYASQAVALMFTYTEFSEFLKVLLIALSIVFTVQRLYIGFLDIDEKKRNKLKLK